VHDVKFRVEHTVEYLYSKPVFLEPHILRLRPRNDPAQKEISFQSEIDPKPSQYEEALDAEGNSIAYVWFDELTDRLSIRARLEAETFRTNPFSFLFTDTTQQNLPLRYTESELLHEKALSLRAPGDIAIEALVRAAVEESGAETMRFLTTLARMIFERATVEVRRTGHPKPPAETVRTMRGACRDLAVLYNECCRTQGIAARFVNGYRAGDPSGDENQLHAWSEVYIPGGGWRGFDATLGLAVADRHLALAASARPALAARVEGTFRGTGARSEMSVQLAIQAS
jgi:transglutaminase-like putative cysteine protease